jgi:hypothetical protein
MFVKLKPRKVAIFLREHEAGQKDFVEYLVNHIKIQNIFALIVSNHKIFTENFQVVIPGGPVVTS